MKITDKFPLLHGETDPRTRRTLTPVRVLTTRGAVHGANYLCERKVVQVAIYEHHDGCLLENGAEGERAAVLVDFGIELHGSLNLSVWGVSNPAGKTVSVRIRLGESASEALTPAGTRGASNDHATRDFAIPVSFYSSNESPESGFRFAYIELETPSAAVELRAVTATLIFRDLTYRGAFASSDPLLDRIWDTAAYTVQLNMQRYLWDGVKRDRLVWTGDMNTEVNTILAVFGGESGDVVRRSLDLVRDVTPPDRFMNGLSSYSLWWVLCHYDWYMGTGDRAYLDAQRDYLCELLPRYYAYIGEDGAERLPEGRFFDWPNRDHPASEHAGLQGLFYEALRAGGALLAYMGESERADECLHQAERLRRHIPDPCGAKQAAAMLSLSGIADPARMCEDVILPGGAAGLSTFLGYFTLSALGEAGLCAEALPILRDYWGGMLSVGATTFWEDFDIAWLENAFRIDEMPVPGKRDVHGDYGAHCYKNFRHSLCHGWASGPAPFLTKYVLGVRAFAPGMRAVRFAPDLGGLAWARGVVPTPRGDIRVELERGADGRTLRKIEAPNGVDVVVK